MSLIDDLDTYGEENDVGPDEQAPREPRGPPDTTTEDFRVWTFPAESSESIPDVYVVARDPDPLDFRMWIFAGRGEEAAFVLRSSHRYSPDEAESVSANECCEVLIEGQSLHEAHCPESVARYVEATTGATVTYPDGPDRSDDSVIQY